MRSDQATVRKTVQGLLRLLLGRAAPRDGEGTRRRDEARAALLAKARAALAQVEPMAARGWAPAESIARQLRWCAALAADEAREERPGPFSMGLIATREFDMYGDRPELASLINEVQRGAEELLNHGR